MITRKVFVCFYSRKIMLLLFLSSTFTFFMFFSSRNNNNDIRVKTLNYLKEPTMLDELFFNESITDYDEDENEFEKLAPQFRERKNSADLICANLTSCSSPESKLKLSRLLSNCQNKENHPGRNWLFLKLRQKSKNIHLEWCPVYKSASTPWMATFAHILKILTNRTENLVKSGQLSFFKLFTNFRLNFPFSYLSKNERVYRMIVVRHPFTRLLSAYKDKIERVSGREFYHRKYAVKILSHSRFRDKINETHGSSSRNKFYSFLEQVKELKENLKVADTNKNKSLNLNYEKPTFGEFVKYLISVPSFNMDEHWRPIYLDCNPCQFKFDFILKVETIEEDKSIIFNLLGLSYRNKENGDISKVWNRWANKSPHMNNYKKDESYFSKIPKNDLKQLYYKYEADFLLFNYSTDLYF